MKFNYIAVIVTYNRCAMLKESIDRLLKQTIIPQKIIVIDNASNDATQEYMEELTHSNELIDYQRMNENLGGSAGFYQGVKIASTKYSADWIALSDDDAFYEPDYFERIGEYSQSEDVECYSGMVKSTDGSIQLEHRRRVQNGTTMQSVNVPAEEYQKPSFEVDQCTFVGFTFSTKLIDKIGLPEKDYFIWYDDSEYSLRIRQHSKIVNVNSAVIVHHNGKVSGDTFVPSWKEYYGMRNQIAMGMKYTKSVNTYRSYLRLVLIKKLLANLIKKDRQPYRKFMLKAIRKGYQDGISGSLGFNPDFYPGMNTKNYKAGVQNG